MKKLHQFYTVEYTLVLENLKTNINGLLPDEVVKRQEQFGKNILKEEKRFSLLKIFFSQLLNPLVAILIFASFITLYLNEHIETFVIWLAIFVNIFFSAYQEYKAENTIQQLKQMIKNKATVKRGGIIKEIEASELTIGDIVILQYGSQVPADIRLIEVNMLNADESILTGESLPVNKNIQTVDNNLISERNNYVFAGTFITNGNGIGVVTHIGEETEIGKIADLLIDTKKTLTPVQTAVKNISWYIFIISIFIMFFVFILGIQRGENIFDMLVLASAVAVGAVPEALPIALTVILAIGVLNISKKGGLIRKLDAAETLGSTTLVLTDKTGTLTEGKLKLENILLKDNFFDQDNIVLFDENHLNQSQLDVLLQATNNFSSSSSNSFENILSKIVNLNNLTNLNDTQKNKIQIIYPFNSTNKYSVSLNLDKFTILGAPDILINNSVYSNKEKEILLEKIDLLSKEGKRIVAIAQKNKEQNFKLENINLLGLFIFSDVLRKDIKEQIQKIESKGIKVKIITGDLPGTAKYIAQNIGINVVDNEILTGNQLLELNDQDLLQLIPKIKIFARVTPEDKLRIGKLYQQLGEIVAMTGDGVNDSPSLKAMDIGISLSSGSEVAKSAADMILLKDDFKTIVDTITAGHTIKKNIQKVFVYLMSSSLDEVFVVTGSLIVGLALPLTALQIIWINILTGTLPALAFAYDKSNYINSPSKIIFDFNVKVLALGIGFFSSIFLFILYYLLTVNIFEINLAQSIFFLCFSIYTLVIAYSFKNLDKFIWQYNPISNWRLNVGVLIGIVLILITVYTSIGNKIFKLSNVPLKYIWILFVWILINICVIEFTKFILLNKKISN